MRTCRVPCLFIALLAAPALAVHWAPVGPDGVTPTNNVLRHTVTMTWDHETDGPDFIQTEAHDPSSLTHVVEQSPGSPSIASTSVMLDFDDSTLNQPADLLVNLPIGDPHRGVRANAQTTSEIFQVAMAGELHSASHGAGEDPERSAWRFRLEPTGAEISGEPIQIRAYAAIGGQVGSTASPETTARVLAEFTVSGQQVLFLEQITDETLPNETFNTDNLVIIPASLGDVIEIDFSVRTDANVFADGPRVALAEATNVRYDIEIRLIRELADLNNDGVIDTADLGRLIGLFGETGTNFDLNADGIIDTSDLGLLISVCGMPSP